MGSLLYLVSSIGPCRDMDFVTGLFLGVDIYLIANSEWQVLTGAFCLQLQIHIDIQLVPWLVCFFRCHLGSGMSELVVIGKQYWINQFCPLLPWLDPLIQHGFKGANKPFRKGKM